MKLLIKWLLVPVATYFGLGWAADNPAKVKHARKQIEQKVESGYEFTLFQFKSFSSEPASPSPTKNKKGRKNNESG